MVDRGILLTRCMFLDNAAQSLQDMRCEPSASTMRYTRCEWIYSWSFVLVCAELARVKFVERVSFGRANVVWIQDDYWSIEDQAIIRNFVLFLARLLYDILLHLQSFSINFVPSDFIFQYWSCGRKCHTCKI